MNIDLELLRYPVGTFTKPSTIAAGQLEEWVQEIAQFPETLSTETSTLSAEQLAWIYRPDGWTIQQVVHHCADSHMNSLIRFKLALTEEQPTIRPYEEALWAQLPDTTQSPISWSLQLLDGLHKKWVFLLKSMSEQDYARSFIHPAQGNVITLKEAVGMYAWHSRHHLAHVQQAKKYKGIF